MLYNIFLAVNRNLREVCRTTIKHNLSLINSQFNWVRLLLDCLNRYYKIFDGQIFCWFYIFRKTTLLMILISISQPLAMAYFSLISSSLPLLDISHTPFTLIQENGSIMISFTFELLISVVLSFYRVLYKMQCRYKKLIFNDFI